MGEECLCVCDTKRFYNFSERAVVTLRLQLLTVIVLLQISYEKQTRVGTFILRFCITAKSLYSHSRSKRQLHSRNIEVFNVHCYADANKAIWACSGRVKK
jgi:hypothetical protein